MIFIYFRPAATKIKDFFFSFLIINLTIYFQGTQLILPLLYDPNNESSLAGGDSICEYLIKSYGDEASLPLNYKIFNSKIIKTFTLPITSALRLLLGTGLIRIPNLSAACPLGNVMI